MIVILIGPSGAGKTTIGTSLARRIHAVFVDADDFHSQVNKEKMRVGYPLTDMDRQPWLRTLNHLLKDWSDFGTVGVLACSALKVKYREILEQGLPQDALVSILLESTPETLQDRLSNRQHEFMSGRLLKNQLELLEPCSKHPTRVCNRQSGRSRYSCRHDYLPPCHTLI